MSNEYHKLSQLATIDSTHSVDNKTSRNKHSPYSPHSAYSYTKFNANHIDIENSRQYPKTTPYLPIDNCNYNQPSMHSCNGGTSKLLYFWLYYLIYTVLYILIILYCEYTYNASVAYTKLTIKPKNAIIIVMFTVTVQHNPNKTYACKIDNPVAFVLPAAMPARRYRLCQYPY